jgi:tRNA pseudouridine55 synthase
MRERDGIMLVDKPSGITSHDVVDFLRKLLKIRRIGHTGILDPNATGLMLMLLGKGTKLSRFLTDLPKRYVARFEFGMATDTYDAEGKIVSRSDPGQVERKDFERLLGGFVGEIEQIVPVFSAAKRDGVALYKLARKGDEVVSGTKIVNIERIDIVEFNWPEAELDIRCSSGTYVRSLAHELGERLGCGGYLKSLRRMEVGRFDVSAASTLDEITGADDLSRLIRPLREAMTDQPCVRIKPQYYGAVMNGRPLMRKFIAESDYTGNGDILAVLLGPDDNVLALARLNMLWGAFDKLPPSEIMGTYVKVIDEGHIRN